MTPENIGEALKMFLKNSGKKLYLCNMTQEKYILGPILIKCLPDVKKVLFLFIYPCIKEGDCSDEWKCVACHFENGVSQIKGVEFNQSYSSVAYADSFRINIAISAKNRITARILDGSKYSHQKYNELKSLSQSTTPLSGVFWKSIIPMFHSISTVVHFVFNERMEI